MARLVQLWERSGAGRRGDGVWLDSSSSRVRRTAKAGGPIVVDSD